MEEPQCVVFGGFKGCECLWDQQDLALLGVSLRKEGFGAESSWVEDEDLLSGTGRLPLSHMVMG